MNAIHTEILYFQRRLDATRAMADAAAGPCARRAHELLAQLYGETLEALSVQAVGLIAEPVLTLAVRSIGAAPRLRVIAYRPRLTLKLAC
ncbi:hypothetical protein C8J44_1269 [Sphingomonas sp. PP-CE-3A-406]|uniref:hypothetical protein n=1 Tax=Sphingomonas sp. PP-CE-3A-406 TaxID=2135659 RepID=UPI000EF9BC55|nr:hypothetical protein [Sphingomonas sp. PP-CE-3A-406]RMB56003.1 hypothetical protein C8J44_1269 [Sphingomonas sp. PP-CE-3A-406]